MNDITVLQRPIERSNSDDGNSKRKKYTVYIFIIILVLAVLAAPIIVKVTKPNQTKITLPTTATTDKVITSTKTISTSTTTSTTTTVSTATSTTAPSPSLLTRSIETAYAIYNTVAGGDSTPATLGTGDVAGQYYYLEPLDAVFDKNFTTVYTSFGNCTSSQDAIYCGVNTGFYLTLRNGFTLLKSFQFGARESFPARDPLTVTIEGSNSANLISGSSWTLIYSGETGLSTNPGANKYGELQLVSNSQWFKSYRFLVTSKRNGVIGSNSVEYAEVQIFGYEPSTLIPPYKLTMSIKTITGLYNTVAGGNSSRAEPGTGNDTGQYFHLEESSNIYDNDFTTVYTSFGNCTSSQNTSYCGVNTGFHFTMTNGISVVQSFRFGTQGTFPARDPLTVTIEGSNSADLISGSSWTLIYSGPTGLSTHSGANKYGEMQTVSNPKWFSSYRFLVTSKRNGAIRSNSVEYAEVEIFGYEAFTFISLSKLTNSFERIYGIYNTVAGGDTTRAMSGVGNDIGQYYRGEPPEAAFDHLFTTVYRNLGNCSITHHNPYCGINTGFYCTGKNGASLLQGFRFGKWGTFPARDPLTVTIEGSNNADLISGSSWTLIYSGPTGLSNITGYRNYSEMQTVSNSQWFKSYRFLVTSKRNGRPWADSVEYAAVEILGYKSSEFIAHLELIESDATITGLYNTVAGGNSSRAGPGTGNDTSQYFHLEKPSNIYDNDFTTVYTSFGNCTSSQNTSYCGVNTGFYWTGKNSATLLQGFRFGTRGIFPARDPLTVTIEGSNSADLISGSSWTLIYSGPTGLSTTTGYNNYGEMQTVSNPKWFSSYRFLVTSKRKEAVGNNSVEYAEVQIFGYKASTLIPPYKLTISIETITGLYNTVAGGNSSRAEPGTGSDIGQYSEDGPPAAAFDLNFTTVYANFGNCLITRPEMYCGINTGFYCTGKNGVSLLQSFHFGIKGTEGRGKPITVTIEGSNSDDLISGSSWTLIYSGPTGLSNTTGSNKYGEMQTVSNSQWFKSYRFLVTSRLLQGGIADTLKYAEIQLFGYELDFGL